METLEDLMADLKVTDRGWYWDWKGGDASRNARLLETGFMSDITLFVGPKKEEIKAHRFILQIASPFFYRLFQRKPHLDKLEISSLAASDFKTFLKYLYTGESKIDIKEAQPLLALASAFQVDSLACYCAEALEGKLTNENVLTLFQQAMNLGNKELVQLCLAYIRKKAWKLVDSEDFLKLTLDCVFEIALGDDLRIRSEGQLFDAIIRWGNSECERRNLDPMALVTEGGETNRKKVLKKLFPLVRYPLMDKMEFVEKVLTQDVLTMEEGFSVMSIQLIPLERRAALPAWRGMNLFSAKSRDYFKAKLHCAQRFEFPLGITGDNSVFTKGCRKQEELQFEVSRKVTFVGLRFDILSFTVAELIGAEIGWDFFTAMIICKEIGEVNRTLFTQEVKPFTPSSRVDDVNFVEGVKLNPGIKYIIEVRFPGSIVYNQYVKNANLFNLTLCTKSNNSIRVNVNEDGEEQEDVIFYFSRNEGEILPINEGLISGLLFKCY